MVLTIGISGASGIVGTVLRRGLKARGYNVIAITQSPMTIVPALTNSTTEIDSVDEVRVVDWTKQPESVRGVLTGCNAFVHLAASAFVTTSWSDAMTINMTGDFLFMQGM